MDPAVFSVLSFLVEELREARARALPPSADFQLYQILAQSARRTRRLERLAAAFDQIAAQTDSTSSG
jgi:hypothetical protein